MPRHTQESCKIRFGEAMARLAKELDQIDQDTPATPVEEPEWWVRMMDQHRTAFAYAKQYIPTQKDTP